jgi:hypothetical protein
LSRGGFSLAEAAAAGAILSMLMVLVGQFFVRFKGVELTSSRKQEALLLVENRLEQAAAGLKHSGQFEEIPLTPDELQRFPGGRLIWDRGEPDSANFSAVTLHFAWTSPSGEPTAPISLTAWLPAASPAAPANEEAEQ